ncbi:hypothetical protein V5O48_012050 [Marasmius crinis-equi]|uniref:SHSP domain-containing protein n=1 Tax=Marasmius crinis-equi TaxID=585013 RepID=A0ABR3F408_9AGAR
MSYPYQYQDDYSTPSTPQFPQWEVIEHQSQPQSQPQDTVQQQQQQLDAGELLTPTAQQVHTPQQLYHQPANVNVEASDHFAPTQPSPVEAPPTLLHRHSHEVPEASTSTYTRHRTATHPPATQVLMGRTPLRRSPGARPRDRANPYPRPQSAGHIATAPSSTSTRLHRVGEIDPSSGAFGLPPPISTSVSSSSEGPSTAPPSVPGRVVGFGSSFSGTSPYNPTPMLPPTTPTFTTTGGAQPALHHRQQPQGNQELTTTRPKRYVIRSDIQYDPRTQVLTASMELPGVNKSRLNVTLSTCLINRIKQVVVLAQASPVFPPSVVLSGSAAAGGSMVGGSMDGGRATMSSGDAGRGNEEIPQHYHVRERRYGEFSRTFVVPAETKPEDISAVMENGVLTLKIACGPPAESADVQVIPIR